MDSTEQLIDSLSQRLTPVSPLKKPWLRALGWVAVANLLVALLVLVRGFRTDLDAQIRDTAYLVSLGAAWLTGMTATLATFEISLPDRSRRWLLLPLPSLALWLYGFGYGCLAHWIAIPAGAEITGDSISCLETLILASVPLSIILWIMLRRTRTLRPSSSAWLGGLAVAGFADTAHLLINVVDPTALVLLMNLGPSSIIIAAAGLWGRRAVNPAIAVR